MGHIIKPDGTIEYVHCDTDKGFSLAKLQDMLEGYIEHLRLPFPVTIEGTTYHQALVNEDGQRMNLLVNEKASQLVQSQKVFGGPLVGNVFFFNEDEVD